MRNGRRGCRDGDLIDLAFGGEREGFVSDSHDRGGFVDDAGFFGSVESGAPIEEAVAFAEGVHADEEHKAVLSGFSADERHRVEVTEFLASPLFEFWREGAWVDRLGGEGFDVEDDGIEA